VRDVSEVTETMLVNLMKLCEKEGGDFGDALDNARDTYCASQPGKEAGEMAHLLEKAATTIGELRREAKRLRQQSE
jgi:hypothetical protein